MQKDANQNQPKVAIIVPIYNVEKYLKDCLDSLINQTYKNLEIVLVDDGSTDKSIEIAKAYFDKDCRITLICKSNGGQGSARNVGIEYVSNGFATTPLLQPNTSHLSPNRADSTNPTLDHQSVPFILQANLTPNALSANHIDYLTGDVFSFASSYMVMGGGDRLESNLTRFPTSTHSAKPHTHSLNFPHKPIDYTLSSCIIFSHSPTPPQQIEYIHFVDSDDMLSLDCIEQCMRHIGECDIIWHDTKYIYEDGISPSPYEQSLLEWLKLDTKAIQKPLKTNEVWANLEDFSCVCGGVFHISLYEKLRFAPQIQSEDALFGMLLFAKAKAIKILSNPLYIYRLRADSTSDHTLKQDSTLKPYPPYLAEIAYTFANSYKIRHYHFAYSCTYICLGLLAYIESLDDSQLELKNKLIEFLQVRAIYAFGAMSFESDPKYVRALLKPLEPYMQKVSKANKIAYFTPKIYKILKWLNGKRKKLRSQS